MKLLNERTQVREVAERWREQYRPYGEWGRTVYGPSQPIYERLKRLDAETATAADVDAIIGVTGWADRATCQECRVRSFDCVHLGDEPDYDASYAIICVDCLRKALALVTGGAL